MFTCAHMCVCVNIGIPNRYGRFISRQHKMTINFAANFITSNFNKNIFPYMYNITSIMHHNPLISNIAFPEMYSHNFIQNTFTKDC